MLNFWAKIGRMARRMAEYGFAVASKIFAASFSALGNEMRNDTSFRRRKWREQVLLTENIEILA